MPSNLAHGRYTFAKGQRLLARADFDRVFKEGITLRSRYVTLLARVPSPLLSRLGIIVAKKSVPRAVDRNRIKRAIRESFRLKREFLPWEVVVIAHKGSGQLPSRALRDVLEQIWVKLLSKVGGSSALPQLRGTKGI